MIFNPNIKIRLEIHVDAYFCGAWEFDWSEKHESVLSRTDNLIKLYNFPVVWVWKMQSEIALSTTESEHVALSQSMQDLLPIIQVLKSLKTDFSIENTKSKTFSTVFEDDKSCIELAT